MLKVYFQNEVASAITRQFATWDKAELDAIDQLLVLAKGSDKVVLGTSRQSPREMERAPVEHRAKLKAGLSELALAENDHKLLGFHTQTDQYGGCITSPLVTDIVDEQLYADLLDAGLKEDDAKHLMYAVHNAFQRFLTCDGGILSRKTVLEKRCPSIRIQKPSELVRELSAKVENGKFGPTETSGIA